MTNKRKLKLHTKAVVSYETSGVCEKQGGQEVTALPNGWYSEHLEI